LEYTYFIYFTNIVAMLRKFVLVFFILLLTVGAAFGQKIYSTNHQYQADVKVYVVDSEYRADLVVFKTDKEYRAKASENKGIWFFSDKQYRADKKVYFVDSEYQADLKVYFTDKEYRAGWKNKEKQPLMY
jgi:hypothetical protein